MAKRQAHEPLRIERTRTGSTLVSLAVAVVFLVLLIIFIAQNDKKVPIHFLGANGTVSEALALIAAAVAGAALVLAVGVARVVQLRVGGRRHNRAVAKAQKQQAAAPPASPAGSASPAPSEPQPVKAQE